METRQTFSKDMLAGFKRLSAELVKVPPERVAQVDAKAAIFIAGMEAAFRTEIRPNA